MQHSKIFYNNKKFVFSFLLRFFAHPALSLSLSFYLMLIYVVVGMMGPVALQQYMSEHEKRYVNFFISAQRLFTLDKYSIFLYYGTKKIRCKKILKFKNVNSVIFFFSLILLFFIFTSVSQQFFLLHIFCLWFIDFMSSIFIFSAFYFSTIYKFCVLKNKKNVYFEWKM